jgi:hypothetical protein
MLEKFEGAIKKSRIDNPETPATPVSQYIVHPSICSITEIVHGICPIIETIFSICSITENTPAYAQSQKSSMAYAKL